MAVRQAALVSDESALEACLRRCAIQIDDLYLYLVGILTGHADLNRHFFIMGVSQDSKCPLCQEDEETSLHFIAHCSALMLLRKDILGDCTISLDTLSNIHWFLPLKFVKASKRFCRP